MYSQTPDTDLAHIWPFTVSDTESSYVNTRNCLDRLSLSFGHQLAVDSESFLVPRITQLGFSDRAWNMVTMNTQTHRWWRKAYFGLKWVGIVGRDCRSDAEGKLVDYLMIEVEWYWLPEKTADAFGGRLFDPARKDPEPKQFVRMETDDELGQVISTLQQQIGQSHNSSSTKGVTMRDAKGQLIKNGRRFTLRVEAPDVDKMKLSLDF